jgi:hypothetical protein
VLRAGVLGVAASLALATALGGCSKDEPARTGGGAHVISRGDLKQFGLTPADLPVGYAVVKDSAPADPKACVRETSDTLAEQLDKLGMQACATVTYAKASTGAQRRTNRPGSAVVLFDTPDHASQALAAVRTTLLAARTANTGTPHSIEVTGLGDEAPRGIRQAADFGAVGTFQLFVYMWRRANIVVYGGSADVLGDFDERSTLELMQKLDARIASYGE